MASETPERPSPMRRPTRVLAVAAVLTVVPLVSGCNWRVIPFAAGQGSNGVKLSKVNGIRVNAKIGGQLGRMVKAAQGAGINLTGGGYRSGEQQIVLRKAHCGPTLHDIYVRASSTCSPPTAPPGRSMHETGRAIDFDRSTTRATAVYRWLSVNAARFGFYNLPSEPWHWSTNGH